jgi:phosphate/sulfate permease
LETIYLIFVIVLFLLAASDLVVGVSNDAVNFLNSAIGSKAAPFRVIMIIASIGVLVGATFSSGMMEVARKGIFHPQFFYFDEIMVIFVAVMVTDILLLDAFNTFGMPTSTTVSIVFELLGAAVGVSIIKMYSDPDALQISQYINSSKALAIISGILLSVGIAFVVGALVQYVTRLILTFRYEKNLKYFGAIWGAIAITAITYFILIKGAKGASFMSDELKESIKTNTWQIIGFSLLGWFLLLQILSWITKFNILRLIVLVGTFALAMAFAGNDLVNFIGVPLAGFESYKLWINSGGTEATQFAMDGLAGSVKTPSLYLLIAGIIMVITLWTSKKARTVTETEINLARQDAGYERFSSTGLSRTIVRATRNMSQFFNDLMPENLQKKLEKRFKHDTKQTGPKTPLSPVNPHFDMVRASVNLTVASILISFATSLKLPLSTTYVTFMVAMGTSLSDRAWGRDSAVYRITGVFSVIGGWFLTAIIAFAASLTISVLLYYGHIYALGALIALIIYIVYRTRIVHKKVVAKTHEEKVGIDEFTGEDIANIANHTFVQNLKKIVVEYDRAIKGLDQENLKELRKAQKNVEKMTSKTKYLKNNISIIVERIKLNAEDTAYYFVQVLDYMREALHSISFLINPAFEHVNNNHKPLVESQIKEMQELKQQMTGIINLIVANMESGEFNTQEKIEMLQEKYLESIDSFQKYQIKRVKAGEVGTRNTILYLNFLSELKNLILHVVNMYKSQRDFVNYKNNNVSG